MAYFPHFPYPKNQRTVTIYLGTPSNREIGSPPKRYLVGLN